MSELYTPEPVQRVIVWRHTLFQTRSKLTGEAAEAAVREGLIHSDFDNWPLMPEGVEQAEEQVRPEVGRLLDMAGAAIDVCLCSPTLRTRQTAGIVLRGMGIPILLMEELRERNRGKYAYAPDEVSERDPLYKIGGESTRNWRPGGEYAVPRAQTVEEVIDLIDPVVLDMADRLAPGGTIGISTHAETMVAMRGIRRLGARNDQRYREPLVRDHRNVPQLRTANWVGQVNMDVYERRADGPEMTHFKTLGYHEGERFETDWIEIVRD